MPGKELTDGMPMSRGCKHALTRSDPATGAASAPCKQITGAAAVRGLSLPSAIYLPMETDRTDAPTSRAVTSRLGQKQSITKDVPLPHNFIGPSLIGRINRLLGQQPKNLSEGTPHGWKRVLPKAIRLMNENLSARVGYLPMTCWPNRCWRSPTP
jgi:hypothetical protein